MQPFQRLRSRTAVATAVHLRQQRLRALCGRPRAGAAKKRKVREDPREQPCCPSLWVKGKVFKRNNIAADTRLRELLEATASRDLKTTQSALCPAGYHVTQIEIKNYCSRRQPAGTSRQPSRRSVRRGTM